MTDDEIQVLISEIEAAKNLNNGSFVAWLEWSRFAGQPDGPMGPKNYHSAFDKVSHVGEHEGEPVAFLDNGKGHTVALWACEAQEFVLMTPLFRAPETAAEPG